MKPKQLIIFSLLFALFSIKGQENTTLTKGITLGYDFSGLAIKLFQDYRTSADISLTAGSFNRFNYTLEGGILRLDNKTDLFHYKSDGQYLRGGFDYNFYKAKGKGDENTMVFIGMRYGLSSMTHNADGIIIIDEKWGNYTPSNLPETKVNAQWLELTSGIRVEVLRNLSLGWSGRLRFLTNSKGAENIKPFIIPGFGKGTKKTIIDANYSIYYTVPFHRRK